ncbi:hypothetical protein FHP05_10120 [Cerasibacillus terrae]|uniref:Uncharacterized protein n=1 Tax=Cerasibacillus terrae TaxID=2498845 RepID=A0A5C8NT63_9BACI|nr:hypothetical protein [Cerasibacillus terrae]TXL64035.1 hypothetical protein FHP05_10120 [Cerasibacillus terrae]
MGYIFLFLIGFGLSITGGISIIAYLNFLPAGVSWLEYFQYITGRLECYFLPLGLIFMMISIHRFPNKL